jgi:RNA ligase (TIGR02306 family)
MFTDEEYSDANPLAEVVTIQKVIKHPNADLLDLVSPDGSGVNFAVVKKGQFSEGDQAIWIDSVNDPMVPVSHPYFAHMQKMAKGDGYARIKTVRLRGIVSRGLLVPLPEDWKFKTNREVTTLLELKKYIAPIQSVGKFGFQSGRPTSGPHSLLGTAKYDVESLNKGWRDIPDGSTVWITEKIHGTNACYGWLPYQGELKFWARSRTLFKKEPEGDDTGGLWWEVAKREDLANKLRDYPGHALYGEVYGPVQDLRYGESEAKFVAFDCWDSNKNRYLTWEELESFCQNISIPTVPVIAKVIWQSGGDGIPDDIIGMAEGNTLLSGNNIREGIVLRWDGDQVLYTETDTILIPNRIIFKLVGNGYLTRS